MNSPLNQPRSTQRKRLLPALLGLLFLGSCMSTLQFEIELKSAFELPVGVKTVGVLDRSQANTPGFTGNMELINLQGDLEEISPDYFSYATVLGLAQSGKVMSDSILFKPLPFQIRRAGVDSFAAPLSEKLVASFCAQHQLDALLVIEYHRDTIVKAAPSLEGGPAGWKGLLELGWRLYTAKTQQFVVEDLFNQERPLPYFMQANPRDSVKQKTWEDQMIQLSYEGGQSIANLILPSFLPASRELYLGKFGPSKEIAAQMEKAGELARTGKWDAAIAIWRPVASQKGLGKTAGKAAFNMAVACEKQGNFELAEQWAKIAANEHNVATAINYLAYLQALNESE